MHILKIALFGVGVGAAVSAATLLPAAPAAAQQLCLVHDNAVEELGKRYGEQVTARGLAQDGKAMVEVFSNDEGAWTILVTDVNGRACVLANGEAWHAIEALKGQPS